jgi:hypothetical protein
MLKYHQPMGEELGGVMEGVGLASNKLKGTFHRILE